MNIIKFDQFINETVIPKILDILINNDGNIVNEKGYVKIRNGNIIDSIVDRNGNSYPAGLDKNGILIPINVDDNGYAIYNDSFLPCPTSMKTLSINIIGLNGARNNYNEYWNVKGNYIDIIPNKGTGWVNVKIDMEVIKKVKRYAAALSTNSNNDFIAKLEYLSNPLKSIKRHGIDKKNPFNKTSDIQKQMSIVMLLRYLSEIKDYFNSSQAGFLFESFIGGLLPGKVPDDNGPYDVISEDNNQKYQIKLYSGNAQSIPLDLKIPCYAYIICLKFFNEIHIYILYGAVKKIPNMDIITNYGPYDPEISKHKETSNYIGNFMIKGGLSIPQLTGRVKSSRTGEIINLKKYVINLGSIDETIEAISANLKAIIEKLWENISEFQYNVETIFVGVDKDHKMIDELTFDKYKDFANENLKNMQHLLDDLTNNLRN